MVTLVREVNTKVKIGEESYSIKFLQTCKYPLPGKVRKYTEIIASLYIFNNYLAMFVTGM